jgi:hypothetical protein
LTTFIVLDIGKEIQRSIERKGTAFSLTNSSPIVWG